MKEKLTDRRLKNMKPAAPGKRPIIWDTEVGNFGVRVTDKVDPETKRPGLTFIVMRRLNGKLIRHKIGTYNAISLEQAREAARDANLEFSKGIDPRARRAAERKSEEQRLEQTFEVVAESFIKRHLATLRSGAEVGASVRRELISRWGSRPIDSITDADVVKMVEALLDKGKPAAAAKMLAHTSKLFAWAVARKTFGLKVSPCDGISPRELLGKKVRRQRVLNDDELRAIWAITADGALGYPVAPFVRFLLATGQRLREVANATWAEFNLDKALWTIPADRMKGDAAHEVPLSSLALDILKLAPRFAEGHYVWTTTSGARPISGFSKFKERLDAALGGMPPWVFHDVRRTVRTRLSGLPVPHNVCELVIAHRQRELDQIYDQHSYQAEKRRALELWGDLLLAIAEPNRSARLIKLAATG